MKKLLLALAMVLALAAPSFAMEHSDSMKSSPVRKEMTPPAGAAMKAEHKKMKKEYHQKKKEHGKMKREHGKMKKDMAPAPAVGGVPKTNE